MMFAAFLLQRNANFLWFFSNKSYAFLAIFLYLCIQIAKIAQ